MNYMVPFKQLTAALPLSSKGIKLITARGDIITRSLHMAGSWRRLALVGSSSAILASTYYGFLNYQRYNSIKRSVHLKEDTMELSGMPDIKPAQKIYGPSKLSFDVTLYQYCSCPFCCKTRTFLDYFGVSYNLVEVDPISKKNLSWSNYKKVPILLVHSSSKDEPIYQINDSSVIISSLGSYLMSQRTLSGGERTTKERSINDLGKILINYQTIEVEDDNGKKIKEIPNKYFLMLGDINKWELEKRETNLAEERMWRDWTDRVLVHSISPNIYRTIPEAIQAFNNFSVMGNWEKNFSTIERTAAIYLGSSVMWLVAKKLKKKYNLKGDVRESLYDNCRMWTKAIGKERQFMGGDKPNLADLSVYGVLSSIEGCTAFNDILEHTNIEPWYFAVKNCCKTHVGQELIQTI